MMLSYKYLYATNDGKCRNRYIEIFYKKENLVLIIPV